MLYVRADLLGLGGFIDSANKFLALQNKDFIGALLRPYISLGLIVRRDVPFYGSIQ